MTFAERTFDTVDLRRLELVASQQVDEFVLHDLRVERFWDELGRHMRYTLRGYIWSEPPKSIRVRYPSTWWDAFKERWFPKWAVEAYPVDYTIETMEGQIFYPKLPHTVPEHVHNLRLVIRKEPDRRYWNAEDGSQPWS